MRRFALLAALTLSGCGGSGDGAASDPSALGTMHAAQRAVAALHSFHIEGVNVTPDGTTRLSGDFVASGRVRASVVEGSMRAEMIVTRTRAYIRADAAFWEKHKMPPRAAAIASSDWVRIPAISSIRKLLRDVDPKTMARCMTVNLGSVRDRGTGTVAGMPVKIVALAGDAPGSAPGLIYMAAKGPPLPVRILQTGPHRTGGSNDPTCTDKPDTSTRSDIRLSRFDEPMRIALPRHAVTPQSIGQQFRSTTES